MKILIVEDHPVDRSLAQLVLRAAGHQVRGVDDADAAYAAIQAEPPDVILLDVQLGHKDGLAVARKLKTDPATSEITIVVVTAHDLELTKAAALLSGCDAFLLKPINTRTLPEQIAALVGRQKPAKPLLL